MIFGGGIKSRTCETSSKRELMIRTSKRLAPRWVSRTYETGRGRPLLRRVRVRQRFVGRARVFRHLRPAQALSKVDKQKVEDHRAPRAISAPPPALRLASWRAAALQEIQHI